MHRSHYNHYMSLPYYHRPSYTGRMPSSLRSTSGGCGDALGLLLVAGLMALFSNS